MPDLPAESPSAFAAVVLRVLVIGTPEATYTRLRTRFSAGVTLAYAYTREAAGTGWSDAQKACPTARRLIDRRVAQPCRSYRKQTDR